MKLPIPSCSCLAVHMPWEWVRRLRRSLGLLLLSGTLATHAATLYVDLNSTAPAAPYTSWGTAATNIQDAVDAATTGDIIMVADGVYQTGSRAVYGMQNRVAVNKAVIVQSVNGAGVTTIVGYQVPGPKNGNGAVRCAYLTDRAVLAGFTLTKGATQTSGDLYTNDSGGGVWCESASAVISNCVLTSNSAGFHGGGAYLGTLINCTLTKNSAGWGGGADGGAVSRPGGCTLNNCTLTTNSASLGGGATYAVLNNCTLTGNSAVTGGGAYKSTVNNCALMANSATQTGGGVRECTLNNCTLTGNSTIGGLCGGAYSSSLNNCIVYYNTASFSGDNYDDTSTLQYCCTTPMPYGDGNFTNAPLFLDPAEGNLRLQANSPCIDAGLNDYAPGPTDRDGRPRIANGTVDVGAYEFQAGLSGLFLGWLQSYGLPTDGSADHADSDGDGMDNWQEWVAHTSPVDPASALRMLSVANATNGLTVTWQSVPGVNYFIEQSAGVPAPWVLVPFATGIPGQSGTTSFTDTNADLTGPLFYRVGVSSQ